MFILVHFLAMCGLGLFWSYSLLSFAEFLSFSFSHAFCSGSVLLSVVPCWRIVSDVCQLCCYPFWDYMTAFLAHFSWSFSHPQTPSLMATPLAITGGGITRRRMHSAPAVRLLLFRPRCASSTLVVELAAVPSTWFILTPLRQ